MSRIVSMTMTAICAYGAYRGLAMGALPAAMVFGMLSIGSFAVALIGSTKRG